MKLEGRLPRADVPTVPMASLSLLLILFFTVTAVFSVTRGLELELPTARDLLTVGWEAAVLVEVHSETEILVDCKPMRLEEIRPYLERRDPDRPVILYTDPAATYQAMITVYDVLRSTGNVSVITEGTVRDTTELFGVNPLESSCGRTPVVPGAAGVTAPVRIEESYVEPEFPELARAHRVEGRVVLHAVVREDGTVGEIEVLQCTPQGAGFEGSAVNAVERWRYEPARRGNRPVDAYLTIVVEFSLD